MEMDYKTGRDKACLVSATPGASANDLFEYAVVIVVGFVKISKEADVQRLSY